MVRYRIHYKKPTPVLDALRLLLVPVIAAVLVVASCTASRLEAKGSTWNSPRNTPTEAPAARAEIQVTQTPAPGAYAPWMQSYVDMIAPAPTPRPPKHELQPTAASRTISPRTGEPTSVDSRVSERSDLQEQQNFSARTELAPESIQSVELSPCQRSAAAWTP